MSTGCCPLCTKAQSACSVNAIAGRPSSIARSQLRSMCPRGASHDHSVCTWRSGGSGTAVRLPELESPAVGYVLEGVAYVSGVLMIGGGVYLVMRGAFPGWWGDRLVWPLVSVNPGVARLQGWAVIVLGASILAIVFTTVAPAVVGGGLVLGAIAAYVVGVGLFFVSTWL